MTLILTALHLFVAFGIIFVVLIQKGSSADMGAAFGGTSQSVFGARGSGSFLGKVTALLATVFMLTSLSLAFFTTRSTTSDSVMKGGGARPPQSQTADPGQGSGVAVPPVAPATDIPVPAKGKEGDGKEGKAKGEEGSASGAPAGGKPIPAFDGKAGEGGVPPVHPVVPSPGKDLPVGSPAAGSSTDGPAKVPVPAGGGQVGGQPTAGGTAVAPAIDAGKKGVPASVVKEATPGASGDAGKGGQGPAAGSAGGKDVAPPAAAAPSATDAPAAKAPPGKEGSLPATKAKTQPPTKAKAKPKGDEGND